MSLDSRELLGSQIGVLLKLLSFKVKVHVFPEKEKTKEVIADLLWDLEALIGLNFRIEAKKIQKFSFQTLETLHNFDITTHSEDVLSLPIEQQIVRRVQKKLGKTLFQKGFISKPVSASLGV